MEPTSDEWAVMEEAMEGYRAFCEAEEQRHEVMKSHYSHIVRITARILGADACAFANGKLPVRTTRDRFCSRFLKALREEDCQLTPTIFWPATEEENAYEAAETVKHFRKSDFKPRSPVSQFIMIIMPEEEETAFSAEEVELLIFSLIEAEFGTTKKNKPFFCEGLSLEFSHAREDEENNCIRWATNIPFPQGPCPSFEEFCPRF